MGLSRKKPLWKLLKSEIPALQTVFLDATPAADFTTVKYIVETKGGGKTKLIEFTAVNTSTGIEDSVYNTIGDSIAISANTIIQGSDVVLKMISLETFPLTIKISKLKTN